MERIDMVERQFNFAAPVELNLYYCGMREGAYRHGYGPAVRGHFLLAFIESGKGRLHCRDRVLPLSGGELLVMFPNERIAYAAEPDIPWTVLWLGVYGAFVPVFFRALGVRRETPVYPIAEPEPVFETLRGIVDLAKSDQFCDKIEVISRLHRVFSLLAAQVQPRRTQNEYVSEALSFIHYNYERGIEARDVAESVNLSVSYFIRLFTRETGVSPGEWILRERIRRACALLEDSALDVGEIARAVGVEDPMYFSRLFKRRTGMTPTAYRKNAQKPSTRC